MLADMSARTVRDYRIVFPRHHEEVGHPRADRDRVSNADGTNYLRSQVTVIANVINFDVTT